MITRGFQCPVLIRTETGPAGTTPDQRFPVLPRGPAAHAAGQWTSVEEEDGTKLGSWGWEEFRALGPTESRWTSTA